MITKTLVPHDGGSLVAQLDKGMIKLSFIDYAKTIGRPPSPSIFQGTIPLSKVKELLTLLELAQAIRLKINAYPVVVHNQDISLSIFPDYVDWLDDYRYEGSISKDVYISARFCLLNLGREFSLPPISSKSKPKYELDKHCPAYRDQSVLIKDLQWSDLYGDWFYLVVTPYRSYWFNETEITLRIETKKLL